MVSKKTQSKAGIAARRRGQQMGDERSQPDKTGAAAKATPALRGRRAAESKFFADESHQAVGSDGEAPRDNTPSIPAAIPTGTKLGESGGEKEFKARQRGKK
jgi:hypothetical protein